MNKPTISGRLLVGYEATWRTKQSTPGNRDSGCDQQTSELLYYDRVTAWWGCIHIYGLSCDWRFDDNNLGDKLNMVKRSVRCGSYKRNFHKIEKNNQIIKRSKLFVNLTLHMKNPLDQNNFKYLTAGTWCFAVLYNVKCAKTPKQHRDLTSEKF